jgi:two-component system alkaline phosphatase synthesis response regulator PhoP
MRRSLLLVEDEAGLVRTLGDMLRAAGYDLAVAGDARSALEQAGRRRFDLVILDVMLPDEDGFAVCRRLRRSGSAMPILMLTARGETRDKVTGLRSGADDYLTKPFEAEELLARIEAQLRRARGLVGRLEHRFGDVIVNVRTGTVTRRGEPVELSARLYELLLYFLEHRGEVLSRDELLDKVWGFDAMPTTRTVDVHVSWLRRQIEPDPSHPRHLVTLRGMGYRFVG